MTIRSFPKTRNEPRKRILLIPVVLILGGYVLTLLHPVLGTGFIGILLALTGVLSVFLVGMVFADIWVSARRTRQMIERRQRELADDSDVSDEDIPDPFQDEMGD